MSNEFRNAVMDALTAVGVFGELRHLLTNGEEEGDAIACSSIERAEETVTESGASEVMRVIVAAHLFPTLDVGCAVGLNDTRRIVTSAKTDPAGASLTVGLSERMDGVDGIYEGVRRDRQGERTIGGPLMLLVLDNGPVTDIADGYAPIRGNSWTLAISSEDWTEVKPPEVGDVIRFWKDGRIEAKVARVLRRPHYWVINARSR